MEFLELYFCFCLVVEGLFKTHGTVLRTVLNTHFGCFHVTKGLTGFKFYKGLTSLTVHAMACMLKKTVVAGNFLIAVFQLYCSVKHNGTLKFERFQNKIAMFQQAYPKVH